MEQWTGRVLSLEEWRARYQGDKDKIKRLIAVIETADGGIEEAEILEQG
jgi:hypothetical protein